jgi:hypothetical protein
MSGVEAWDLAGNVVKAVRIGYGGWITEGGAGYYVSLKDLPKTKNLGK